MALACIDSISDKLNFIESNLGADPYLLKKLEVELRFLRTFFLYARKWSNQSLSSSLCSVKNVVIQIEQELISLLSLGLKDRLSSHDMAGKIILFHKMIESIKQEIIKGYSLSGCLLQSSCSPVPVADELMEFMDSLLKNLDLIICEGISEDQFDLFLEKLSFLNNFIRLGVFREVEQRQLEGFLIHCEVVAVNAAHLTSVCWYHRKVREVLNAMKFKISAQVQKIKPIDTHVHEMYSQVLIASKLQESSHSLATKAQKSIVGNFIDSLLGSLCEILDCGNNFMVSVKHRIGMLYEGLQFLRHIIKKPEKFDGLHEKTKDLFGAMVTDAGIVIFSLHTHEMGKGWTRGMDLALSNFLEKIKPIKVEVAKKYPAKSTFNFPVATNELDFIDLLIENLKQLATCKVDSNSLAMDKFQEVHEDLVFFRSFLENIVVQCNLDEKLQALWNRIIVVAYKVEFVIDSLMVGDISYSYSSPLMLCNTIIEETKLVKTEALEIDVTGHFFEAQEAAKTSSHLPSLSTVPKPNEVVVGFKEEAREIIDRLTRGSKQLDIVSIVGMPGLGKTTLASKVYHDPSILLHFHKHAWCVVSQVYCMKDLLCKILICITDSNQYSEMDENDLVSELYQCLKGNRYVIVLDDVWGIEAWNVLKRPFPDDANGSRILLTSRCNEVGKLFHLCRLTDDESWELLQKKLVLKEGYPPALDVLGKQIARNCNGLPLQIVIIAGILASSDKVGWEEVVERTSTKIVSDEEQCRNVLELSYKHLPNYLKPCFLYFGTFLEDQEILVWRLIRLWIAEGFVQKNGLKSLEDIAEDYIMALIRSNLVMVAKRNSMGGVKTCHIHDLLHEFCVAKAKEQNFLQFVHGYDEVLNFDEPYNNLRRLCIYTQRMPLSGMSRPFCPHVRSLLFLSQSQDDRRYAMSDKLFILRLKLLRVLDLGKVYLHTFPDEIVVLVQLRYLAIVGSVKYIPSSIENLSNLETFVLTADAFSVSVPGTIWNMQKLMHLYVRDRSFGFVLPKYKLECSPHLYNLHTIEFLRLHLGEKILRKFPYIRKLKCIVFADLGEIFESSNKIVVMDFLSQLESLELRLYYSISNLHSVDFHFPLNLKMLTLNRFSWSKISTVGKLPNLEVLKLLDGETDGFGMWDEEGVFPPFGILPKTDRSGIWEMEEGEFPKLKFLKLKSNNIVRWVGSGDQFPRLQKLVLEHCMALKELPLCLENISTLEMIEVYWCSKSLASLVRKIKEEHVSMGNEDLKISILK